MRRREFLTLLSGAAAALWPITANAQQPVRVVGFVSSGSADGFAHLLAALHQGLRDKGYVDGQNLTIEYRWADGHYDRLPALAADLVQRRVALIISTGGIVAVHAAKAATTEIPVVFASGDDPVRFGIVPSLNHPGGNVTGVTIMSSALVPKRLEIIRELLPGSRRLGLLVNGQNPNAEANVKDAEAAARTLGEDLVVSRGKAADIDSAFQDFNNKGVNTVLITTDPDFNSRRERIAQLAVQNGIALVSDFREYVDAGGLMSYGASIVDMYRRLGIYVGRVLDGAKPADLPIEQPTRFDLILNLKTAKALGLTIPSAVVSRADEVIE